VGRRDHAAKKEIEALPEKVWWGRVVSVESKGRKETREKRETRARAWQAHRVLPVPWECEDHRVKAS
jgi:hypothetical protein